MNRTMILAGLALLAFLAAACLWLLDRRRTQARRRVIALSQAADRPKTVTRPLLRSSRRDAGSILDAVIGRHAPLAAPLPVTRPIGFALGALSAAGAHLFVHLFLAAPAGLGAAAALLAFLATPRVVCRVSLARQRFLLLDQMPGMLGLLVRAVRTGIPVTDGARLVANECPSPTAEEFLMVVQATLVGTPLEDALEAMAERTGMPEYRFFVTAISLQRETGGNLGETLTNLASVIRARKALRLKAKALSSEARTSVYVLSALPFVSGAALSALNPQYMDKLFHTQSGHTLLGLAGALLAVGVGSMQLMIRRLG
ncbi:type II secretion system F family protein [Azospirillum sp.]|uniref:type II secretion system F family protein n=1 Tax=Azospirillum sp. TaxID=34012 RepID=UPI003D72BC8C